MRPCIRPAGSAPARVGCALAVLLLAACVVDDQIGVRSKERIRAGVTEPVEGATYDEATDTYSIERKLDLDGPKSETEQLIDSMRARDR